MPGQTPRQSYRATTNTVVYWVAAGLVVFIVRPFIPPVVNDRLANSSSGYVRQASGQRVEWQEVSPDVFEQSRATGKPIVLTIGTEWSDVSQALDNKVFASGDVAERLNRYFIPVRLDAQMYRAWSSCFLQLVRAQQGWEPHNQLLFLSGSGQILRYVDFPLSSPLDDLQFIAILDELRFPKSSTRDQSEQLQKSEHQTLVEGFEQAVPEPDKYRDELIKHLSDSTPGFSAGRDQILPARDYVFLTAAGETEAVRKQIYQLLSLPSYSWLDGGFFRSAQGVNWRRVSLSMSAARNADMLETLATLTRYRPGSLDRKIADRLFNSLLENFVADGKCYAALYSRLDPTRRSARYSVSFTRARKLFGDGAGRASQVLGLDANTNPLLVPHLKTWPVSEEAYAEFMGKIDTLRQDPGLAPPNFAGESSLDVGTRVVTALLRYAALVGRDDLLDKALAASEDLQSVQFGLSDVKHSFVPSHNSVYLGDYLNFAEMELTRFAIFGDIRSLEVGRRVLDRALSEYQSNDKMEPGDDASSPAQDKRGVINNANFPEFGDLGLSWRSPKLVDDDLPATCAQMSMLLRAYASLESDAGVRKDMRDRSSQILLTMAPAASKITQQVGTFNLAALFAEADTTVFVVGPGAVQLAKGADWLSDLGWRFPLLGQLRPDIQAKGPGFYIEARGKLEGPLTREAVEQRLTSSRLLVE